MRWLPAVSSTITPMLTAGANELAHYHSKQQARPLTFMTAGLLSALCALKPVDGRALSSAPISTRDRILFSGVPTSGSTRNSVAVGLFLRQTGGVEARMPDTPMSFDRSIIRDSRGGRTDNSVTPGLVLAAILAVLFLVGTRVFDTGAKTAPTLTRSKHVSRRRRPARRHNRACRSKSSSRFADTIHPRMAAKRGYRTLRRASQSWAYRQREKRTH